jgi:WD40 repeat protein
MVFLHPPVPCAVRAAAGLLGEGDRYFTGGTNASVQVRDVLSGIVLEEYPAGDPAWGLPLAATPDGRFIAREYAPVIDRLASAPAAFPTHKNIFDSSSFSPDGAWMASGSYDDTLKLWDLASGRFLGQVGHHQRAVLSLAFSPEGTLLASSQEGLVRLWRVARPPAGRVIPTGATSLARLSTDGLLLAPSGYTRRQGALTRTRAVELATGKAVGPELVPGGVIMDAAFSPDGAWLALIASTTPDRLNAPFGTQGGSGNLQWWNHLTGERVGEPIPLPSEPRGVAVHPSGRWVGVYCGAGEGVEVEVSTRQVRRLFDHRRQSRPEATLNNGRCAYSPDGRLFVAWGLEDLTHFWDRDAGRELIEPVLSGGNSFDVAFSGNTVANVVVARTNRVEFRDIRTGQDVVAPIPHAGWPFLGRFSADGGLLLTTGRDRVGRVWDWRRGRLICPALPHEDEVMAGAFVPGRPWVVTGGHDGLIQCWDYRTGMPVCPPLRRDGWVLELHVTSDGATLVAGGLTAGGIEVFDFASLTPEPDLPPESARLLAEIEASAEVHPGGDLVPLSAEDWLRRWQRFRQRHPDFAGHRLEMDPAARRAWHEARARELESTLPTAAPWHRRRLE